MNSAAPQLRVIPGGNPSRGLPHSLEAEEYFLACCLIDGSETIAQALQAGISGKAFYDAKHELIWSAIVKLFRERPPVDLAMVAEELKTSGRLDSVGGYLFLTQLGGRLSTTVQAGFFIDKLLELSALRLSIRVGNEIVENSYAFTGGRLDDLFAAQLSALSSAVRHARRGSGVTRLAEKIDAVAAETAAMVEGRVDTSGWIHTGMATFDARCLPLGSQSEDHFVVDAAGSGLGKSAFMRQVAGVALERGQRARIYSRETSTAGCIEQLAASRGQLDLKHRARWTKDMLQKFTEQCAALRDIADKRLWCVENTAATPLMTLEDLEDDARYFAATQGAPHLWIIDYLQLFGAKRRFNSREQEVAYVSHRLQGLCRELGGVWIVGCQMNEGGLREMRTLKRDANDKVIHRLPGPGDLRESQAIFHDADRVIAHYLPPVDSRDQDQTSPNVEQPEVWLCQIKRRKGATGVVKCWFEKRFTRFTELPSFTHGAATQSAGSGMTKAQFKGERPPI
jgi:replicative DNA helicase